LKTPRFQKFLTFVDANFPPQMSASTLFIGNLALKLPLDSLIKRKSRDSYLC
jgi:hypothetical protein